jgi:hypothetical protein
VAENSVTSRSFGSGTSITPNGLQTPTFASLFCCIATIPLSLAVEAIASLTPRKKVWRSPPPDFCPRKQRSRSHAFAAVTL